MKLSLQTTLAASALALASPLFQGCAATAPQDAPPEPHTIVVNDFDAAKEQALASHRLLLVNSTAHTAINARKMEVATFQEPVIARALAPFVEARLYGDAQDPAARASNQAAIDAVVKEAGSPIYVVLDPATGRELGRWKGMSLDPAAFARFLDEASER